jgi:BlaI family penicillinase repressor
MMARPRHGQPTPAELQVLNVLWDARPMTVRQVMEQLEQRHPERDRRAYTSVMSLLNVMADKALLRRTPRGRAFLYAPRLSRQKALGEMLGDLLKRAFAGSTSLLVTQLLDHVSPSEEELLRIRQVIADYRNSAERERK